MKLETIKKKRLIINIIAIRQTYKKKKSFKICYINKQNNPIDIITKLLSNKTLEKFINTNKLIIRIQK
jgi:hypothetical protein